MVTCRMDVAYVGFGLQGWQSQGTGQSVQEKIEKGLSTFLGEPVKILGASRTDAGVHAEQQVCVFQTAKELNLHKLREGLNALTPPEIVITRAQIVGADFHPIRDCLAKAYRYSLWVGRPVSPFRSPYVWQVPQQINIQSLSEMAQQFVGRHDFTSFCAADSGAKTKTRTIIEAQVHQRNQLVDIWILGEGFLKQMIRSMVGTLVQISLGREKRPIMEIIECRDRTEAGPTAPAQGLCLHRVFYGKIIPLHEFTGEKQSPFGLGSDPQT